jgi:hypothetical protein
MCKDIPADESCGGIDYCTREVAGTMTFSTALNDMIAAYLTAAGVVEVVSKDICALVAPNAEAAAAQQEEPTCIAAGMTVAAGSVVVNFALKPDPNGRTAMESMNELQRMVAQMESIDLEDGSTLNPAEPRTAWYEVPGGSGYARTEYGAAATGLTIKRSEAPTGMVRLPVAVAPAPYVSDANGPTMCNVQRPSMHRTQLSINSALAGAVDCWARRLDRVLGPPDPVRHPWMCPVLLLQVLLLQEEEQGRRHCGHCGWVGGVNKRPVAQWHGCQANASHLA